MTTSARRTRSTTHQTAPSFTRRESVRIESAHRGACVIYSVNAPFDPDDSDWAPDPTIYDDAPPPTKTYLRTSSKLHAERFANKLADDRAAWFAANEPEGL